MNRVGILGGSFDPPHKGHIEIARKAYTDGLVDEVWMIPCYDTRHDKKLSPFEERMRMCNLAIKDESFPIYVDGSAPAIDPDGKAIDLVTGLRERFPMNEFKYIIGMDNAIGVDGWYKWDKVIREIPFIIFDRPYSHTGEVMDRPDWIKQKQHTVMKMNLINCSSSAIRTAMKDRTLTRFGLEQMNIEVFLHAYQKRLYETSDKDNN